MNDATWIADLLAHGLIRASFVPPQPIQELSDLTLVQHTQRIQAVLEEANVKLSSVITDVSGVSGRRILQAIVAGETDPEKLSELGGTRLAATCAVLADALRGRIRSHHRFLIGQHLKTIEQLEETIAAFDARIEAALEPFRDTIERLKQVPGLSGTSAQILIAEIGTDMRQFPTDWSSPVLGGSHSAPRRECREAALDARQKRRPMVETRIGSVCLGRGSQEEQLLSSSVPPAQGTVRPQKSCCRPRGLHPDHRLALAIRISRNPARAAAKLANRIRNLGSCQNVWLGTFPPRTSPSGGGRRRR
jgi:hypothetical protein